MSVSSVNLCVCELERASTMVVTAPTGFGQALWAEPFIHALVGSDGPRHSSLNWLTTAAKMHEAEKGRERKRGKGKSEEKRNRFEFDADNLG